MIAISLKCAAIGSAPQLAQIGRGHVLKTQTQLGGQLRHIPENITEFQSQILNEALIHDPTAIANQFLNLVGDLAGLSRQTKGRIDEIVAGIGVSSRVA